MPKAQTTGVRKSALFVTTVIRGHIIAATGDGRLSGVGKKGAKVGASYKMYVKGEPYAVVRAKGPLHLIERDTSPHTIYPKGRTFEYATKGKRAGNVRRRGKGKALKIGENFRAYAEHPGTRGQHPFERGRDSAEPYVAQIMQTEVRNAIRKAW